MKIGIIGEIHNDGWDILRKNNYECFQLPNIEEKTLINDLQDVDGILLRTANLHNGILNHCKKLKIISRHGVGYDNLDVSFLNKNNIALTITSTSNAVSVAEHVLTFFLILTKKIHLSDKLTKEGKFKQKSTLPNFFELFKKNIMIFGFGRIGQAVAKRCLGFDCNVYVHDPFVPNEKIKELNCNPIDKNEGLKLADYISLHLPLNNDTKNFISKEEISLLKSNAIIVNTSRGGIVNEKDLFDALKNHNILGAGLDVFEIEPPDAKHPLFELDNILLTPHNAALTLECRKRMAVEAADNIVNYLSKNKDLNYNNFVNELQITR